MIIHSNYLATTGRNPCRENSCHPVLPCLSLVTGSNISCTHSRSCTPVHTSLHPLRGELSYVDFSLSQPPLTQEESSTHVSLPGPHLTEDVRLSSQTAPLLPSLVLLHFQRLMLSCGSLIALSLLLHRMPGQHFCFLFSFVLWV